MDSGNSACGSLPSYSSGGDDEYDSRAAESFATFLSPPSVAPPLQPPFDPFSSYRQFQNSNSPFCLRNMNPRSEPCNNPSPDVMNSAGLMTSFQEVPGAATSALDSRVAPQNQTARNPKKRSRASRRAPTTVLTTDTTNFRAMVQEFTGIPAPPFTSSTPFRINSHRLDLFCSSSPSSMVSKLPHEAAVAVSRQPLFLRRPFQLKLQPPPLLPVSSSSLINTAASAGSTPALHDHYPLPMPTLNSNIFNPPINPNPASNFFETSHEFPFPSGFNGVNPSGAETVDPTLRRLQQLAPSDQIRTRNDPNIRDWSWNRLAGPDELVDRHQARSWSQLGNGTSSATSTSDLNGRKAPENVGTVESWILSSE